MHQHCIKGEGRGRAQKNELKLFGWVAECTIHDNNFIYLSFMSFPSTSPLHGLRTTAPMSESTKPADEKQRLENCLHDYFHDVRRTTALSQEAQR